MNITFITSYDTQPDIETVRIKKAAEAAGHTLTLYNSSNFEFDITNNQLNIPNVTNGHPDLVIVRAIHNSLKQISMIISYFRTQHVKVFDDNFCEHRYSINKITDLLKLSQLGFPLPNTSYSKNYADIPNHAIKLGYPIIINPVGSGKGNGVLKIDTPQELNTLLASRIANALEHKSLIMQEYVPYQYDLRLLFIGDKMFCMRRIPPTGDFRANFSIGGTVELFSPPEAVIRLAKNALHAVGLTICGVDILLTPDQKAFVL